MKTKPIIPIILGFAFFATVSASEWKIEEESIPKLFTRVTFDGEELTEKDFKTARKLFRTYVYSIKKIDGDLTLRIERLGSDGEFEIYTLSEGSSGLLAGTKEGEKIPSAYLLPIEKDKMRFWWGSDPTKSVLLIPKTEPDASGQRR